MNKLIFIIILLFVNFKSHAESGVGIEEDKFRYGITYYNSLGGIEDTNLLVGYFGIKF